MITAETHIMQHLAIKPGSTGSELRREICSVRKVLTVNTIHQVLGKMQAEGLIHRKGNTSGARWYCGPDNIQKRNEVINRLRGLATDMRKTAVLLAEFSPANSEEMRGAANMVYDWIENLEDGYAGT